MSAAENIERLIKKFYITKKSSVTTSAEMDKRVLDDALAAYGKSKTKKTADLQPIVWRIIMKSKITKLATAAVVILAVVLTVTVLDKSVTPAFADVIEKIYEAYSVTYDETFYPGEYREFTTKEMIIETGVMRTEFSHGDVSIFDLGKGVDLHLMKGCKRAILTQRIGRSVGTKLFNYLSWVKNLHTESGKYTGQEKFNGNLTNVFVVDMPFEKTTVWVDPQTNLPIRVERVMTRNPDKEIIVPKLHLSLRDFGGKSGESRSITISSSRGSPEGISLEMVILMDNFTWNADLDELLFSLEAPEGYVVEQRQFDVTEEAEKGLVKALAFWTEMSGGVFPEKINELADPNKIRPMLIKKFNGDANPREELESAMQQGHIVLKGLFFAQEQKIKGDWHYYGEGVKLGEAYKPVCWWKFEDSNNYQVIYGDLSIGTVAAEDLPE